jgi:chromosome segregation ATPase
MSGAWRVTALALLAGCATAPAVPPPAAPVPTPSALLLARADGLLAGGEYEQAQEAYGDFARQYADDSAAPRALATRDLLASLRTANREVFRLNAEALRLLEQSVDAERDVGRLRRDLGTRESELARMRLELAERQAELGRLVAEAEQLRKDLEKLKSVDLRLERRR